MIIDRDHKQIVFDSCHDTRLVKNLTEYFESTYKKEDLYAMLMQIVDTFDGYSFRMSNESWPLKLLDFKGRYAQTRKGQLLEPVVNIYAEESNRAILAEVLPANVQKMWSLMGGTLYCSDTEAKRILGHDIYEEPEKKDYYYSSNRRYVKDLCWFGRLPYGNWYRQNVYFYIPSRIRTMFAGVFPIRPAGYAVERGEELTFTGETDTISLMPVMTNMWMGGQIEKGRFRMMAASVNRCCKMLKVTEWQCAADDKNARNLRGMMMLNTFALWAEARGLKRKDTLGSPQESIRAMVSLINDSPGDVAGTVLQFLNRNIARTYEYNRVGVLWNCLVTLLTANKDEWTEASAYIGSLYEVADINNALRVVDMRAMEDNSLENVRTGGSISPATFMEQATIPAALNLVGLLASIGVVEMVYVPSEAGDPAPLQGLRRFRLTPLGMYAFKLVNRYKLANIDETKYFELDDTRLLIHALGESNPYEGLLQEYAAEVSPRRYAVTPATFLKGCQNTKGIEKKIDNFKQIICENPPRVWTDFFDRMLSNSKSFVQPRMSYAMSQVSPDAYELHELLVTDPVLKKMIIRAENFIILYEVINGDAIRDRLRQLGYLY